MAWHRQGLVVGFYTLKGRKNCGIDLKRCLLPKKGFESLSRRSTTTLPLKPWYRWFNIFFICLDSYLNSYVMKCSIWIQSDEEYCETICQNSFLWIHLWIHALEFMIMQSYTISWSLIQIYEFNYMNNSEVIAGFLWMNLGIHIWNHSWIH